MAPPVNEQLIMMFWV